MAGVPDLLQLDEIEGGRCRIHMPSEWAEGRGVVFNGQYLAEMTVASEQTLDRRHSM